MNPTAVGLIFCSILFGFYDFVTCYPEVKLLHVLFRHGDKVPDIEFQNYPLDPYGNHSYYPIGSGGLTNDGKMREYKIGKMLRDRYNDFFGPNYLPDEIYARSTAMHRTQMSLQLVLAGLFPPIGQQIWNPDLPWQPVSVFSENINEDFLLFPQDCSMYQKAYRNFLQSKEARQQINKYNSILAYLTKHTGKTVDTTSATYYLYNLLKEEELQGLTLPSWSSEVYPFPMMNITILSFDHRSYTTQLKRLNGGVLLKRITGDMQDLRRGCLKPRERKAFFYSAHENNVAAMARTLGTNVPQLPAYGSTIIFETLQDRDKDDEYFVRVLHYTGVTEKLITQTIPGCSEVCPLDEFLKLLRDVIPDQTEYCHGGNIPTSGSSSFPNNILRLAVLAIIIRLHSD
ncbi:venom acid phosphatase Acph-1-like [Neodiprion fabricii]|uniref:venom acid phosphatase Acph-1-like n=1 Tax=Neodiprion fabricii TaxID=2872261 RepID=UPI001ED93EBC|nr:venom acid phosphatase Acph-1-like [Neodiprion fabricii]